MNLKDKREELLKKSNKLKGAINRISYNKKSFNEVAELRAERQEVKNKYLFYKNFIDTQRKVG